MEIYSTEEQQEEAIKKFFRENGTSLIVGAVLGIGGLWGWNYYDQSQLASAEQASDAYTQLLESVGEQEADIQTKTDEYIKQYQDTSYAILAAFVAAKEAVDTEQLDVAVKKLQWASDTTQNAELRAIAITRLARVQLQLESFDQALKIIDQPLPEAYKSTQQEIKGDIYLAKQDVDAARQAYQAAVDAGGEKVNPVLQIKLDDLAEATANL